jgi:threonine dehydratase
MAQRNLLDDPLTIDEFDAAADFIGGILQPTPQIAWPLLAQRCDCEVWVKHENHLPTGAFKVRGGLWFIDQLKRAQPGINGVVAATRGNHGQSVAFAARRNDLQAVIVVPHGNNPEKNAAMKALGAELIEHGADFNEAMAHAVAVAGERDLLPFPSFDARLVQGVGTYSVELLRHVPDLDAVYVPIGLGSGICGMIAGRNALGLDTEIIGVVSTEADTYARSFAAGRPIPTASATTLADGLAVRVPDENALQLMLGGVSRIVAVSDAAILEAIRYLLTDTHNLAEGAGASPLAALLTERDQMAGRRVGIVMSGGNLDRGMLLRALQS